MGIKKFLQLKKRWLAAWVLELTVIALILDKSHENIAYGFLIAALVFTLVLAVILVREVGSITKIGILGISLWAYSDLMERSGWWYSFYKWAGLYRDETTSVTNFMILGMFYLWLIGVVIFLAWILKLLLLLVKRTLTTKRRVGVAVGMAVTALVSAMGYGAYRLYVNMDNRIKTLETLAGGKQALLCNKQEVVAKTSQAIVRVVGGASEGSGVIVKDNGTIITNFHVIQTEASPKVVFTDYSFKTAKIILADKAKDIAILKIEAATPNFIPIVNRNQPLNTLDNVYSFGFPLGTNLAGGPTVQEGRFVSMRYMDGISYIHTDLSLQSGQSGGALTDRCGNLLGINQMTLSGAAFTISTGTVLDTWFNLLSVENPLKDVKKIEFKSDESPEEAVRAFYNYQKVRQLDKAYTLLSPEAVNHAPFEEWVKGYAEVIDVEVVSAKLDEKDPYVVAVKLISQDLVGQNVVYKYFEGLWRVVKIDGHNRLTDHNIKEIPQPGWEWFY